MTTRADSTGAFLIILLTIFVIALALFGCAGPSKARYAELLHECRDANREHLRLVKEYQSAVEENDKVMRDLCDANRRPIPQALCDDLCTMPAIKHPEQGSGTVEMGLGGY